MQQKLLEQYCFAYTPDTRSQLWDFTRYIVIVVVYTKPEKINKKSTYFLKQTFSFVPNTP